MGWGSVRFSNCALNLSVNRIDVQCQAGTNLKKFREERGFSQEAFADLCGLHRTYISGIERGVRNPTVLIVEKIAKALKISAAELLQEIKASSKYE
ncbi:helix-turn-helix domain-containing protein [Hyphomicrobium sp. ghe19]|uniref:helix-turn-helix domain-containing protein n=1 Tax=Hyphomicrobium sp. ghe19 TaxID=2682968 RepID=UPI00136705AB|nr:HTH-type transcriptional regulator SinR [Hyphomicrobium sp. ghe19]